MKKLLVLGMLPLLLCACESEPREDLKSPCVGIEKSPCDRHSPLLNG